MIYKNVFFVLALCTFMGNISASEETEEATPEVYSEAEMEQLEKLLKAIESEEFIKTVQAVADTMVESTKVAAERLVKASESFGLEAAKITAEQKKESTKIAAEALVKASENFGLEAAKKWADKKKEEAKIAEEALIKSPEKSDSETFNLWEPVIVALISLYAAKTIASTLNN